MTDYLSELFSLSGLTAVVTGGSSGIGLGMATALARAGARTVLVARDPGRLDEAVTAIKAAGGQAAPVEVSTVSADLADRAEVNRAAEAAAASYGEPDILVNCAGVNLRPPLAELTEADWDLTMAVNLTAPFLLGQRFGPAMAARGWGRIINVTSQQAGHAFANSGGYGASKGGLASLTRSQSEAWAASGVCCNNVCPGFVPTRLNAAVANDPARSAAMAARTMVNRNGDPADFAGATVFLASKASDYVTGHTLYVDGGFAVT
jgi:NAD(P)-dependent dehydrogenase (short-subunit alcohol dehydrogenase family)